MNTENSTQRSIMKHPSLTRCLPLLSALLPLAGCKQNVEPTAVAQPPQTVSPTPAVIPESGNNFPTLARVEYVLQCMLEHGGQNYDNLYHCVCAADTIAGKLSYEEFAQAQTFTYLYNMPGERGGQFRDPPQSGELRTRLKEAKALANSTCFPEKPPAGRKSK